MSRERDARVPGPATGPARDGRLANVAAALLAGGASSRMGRDKAHIEAGGLAFATRIARLLDDLFEDVLLVGGDPPAEAPGRRVSDVEGPRCALRGLVSAFEAAQAERVLVVATDLPQVSAELLLGLACWPEADAVVPKDAQGRHPLCAIYRREPCLAAARTQLDEGSDLSLAGLLAAVGTVHLEGAALEALAPGGRALLNVNTPDELARMDA